MKNKQKNYTNTIIGAMLVIAVAIMPLIVRVTFRALPPELLHLLSQDAYPGGVYADLFTHWKGVVLLTCAIVIAFFWVSDWATSGLIPDFKGMLKKPPVFLSISYLFFVIISAIFSRYSYTSWFGTYDRSEGAFMWLAYFTVFFAAMYFVRELKQAKIILYGLVFSSVIMGLVGVSQFMGFDFFNTDFSRWLITVGHESAATREGIRPEFVIAYGTLFNPNTFGKYTAMLSPILLLAALTYNGKKIVNMLLLAAGLLMLFGVFGSSSLGGLVGIVTAVFVLIVTYVLSPGKFAKKYLLYAVPVIAVIALAVWLVPPLNERVSFLFGRLGDAMRAETHLLKNISFEGDTMTVFTGEEIHLRLTVNDVGIGGENWITILDGQGEVVPAAHRAEHSEHLVFYTFDVPGYRVVTIEQLEGYFLYHTHTHFYALEIASVFALTLHEDRIFGLTTNFYLIDFEREIPAWGFYGRENWGSNRGYLWSRTFPLMPRRVLLGSGPDTFVNVFPQHDIVSMYRFWNQAYTIPDKAHNLFLQTWINTGGISAILLFGLFGHYLVSTFLSLIKKRNADEMHTSDTFSYGLRLGLLAGISAFCMASMATDSTIGSTGVFFVLLGVGYGVNR